MRLSEGMNRREFLAAPFFLSGLLEPVANARAPTWKRDTADARWVQGSVVVSGGAEPVWKRLERADQWATIFTDIKSLRVTFRDTDEWKLKVETQTFACGVHDYHVHLSGPYNATIWIEAPGVSGIAYLKARDVERSKPADPIETRIDYSLFIDMKKVMPWFGTEAELRKKQEAMVERHLVDLQRAFSTARSVA